MARLKAEAVKFLQAASPPISAYHVAYNVGLIAATGLRLLGVLSLVSSTASRFFQPLLIN
jgi:hypothetical protein